MKKATGKAQGAEYLKRAILKAVNSDIQNSLKLRDADCDHVVRMGVSSPLHLRKKGPLVTLSKTTSRADGSEVSEFTLTVRVDEKSEWWPVDFETSDGRKISAEIFVNGKRLTNVQAQDELIEIANTWGKSISGQKVTRELDGTLSVDTGSTSHGQKRKSL